MVSFRFNASLWDIKLRLVGLLCGSTLMSGYCRHSRCTAHLDPCDSEIGAGWARLLTTAPSCPGFCAPNTPPCYSSRNRTRTVGTLNYLLRIGVATKYDVIQFRNRVNLIIFLYIMISFKTLLSNLLMCIFMSHNCTDRYSDINIYYTRKQM